MAIFLYSVPKVTELLQSGADFGVPLQDGLGATTLSALYGHGGVVDLLYRSRPNLFSSASALHSAVLKGDVRELRELLDAGADVSERDDASMTPLHLAALLGRPDALRILVFCPRRCKRAGSLGANADSSCD